MKLFSVSLLCAAAAAAGEQKMTFLDVLQFRTVAAGTLAKTGKSFAYTVSTLDWKAGRRFTDLYLSNTEGGPGRQMTFTADKDESSPAFSPDGQWLAFLSNREAAAPATPAAAGRRGGGGAGGGGGESNQLYLMGVSGGEARNISGAAGGVGAFAFSRDGKWIAFLAGRAEARQIHLYDLARSQARPLTRHATGALAMAWAPDSSRLYFTAPDALAATEQRRMELRFDVRIVNPATPPRHLWEVAVEGGAEKRLTSGEGFSAGDFQVSRDGRWITFTGNGVNRFADALDRRDSEAYLLEASTGRLERLTDNRTGESTPIVSPDGKWVAIAAADEFTYFRSPKIYVRTAAPGGKWKKLLAARDGEVSNLAWARDSRGLYFDAGVGASADLFSVDSETGAVEALTRHNGVTAARYDAETDRFVILYENPRQPRDYFLSSSADIGRRDRWTRMSDANPQVERFALGSVEVVSWKSSDGTTVEGLLTKPVGYQPGTKYPLIVQIHGGPASAVTQSFSAGHGSYLHVFASGGYAVLQPNYRGSTNYGEKFRMEIAGDYFRQGFDDIMTGVDAMIQRGFADPDKLGMMGWSAGGHWSNWTLTHTNRFKAISSGAGAVNWISMYAQTDVHSNREYYFKGTPYENWDHYIEVSPLKYIRNAKTPTLIHVGQEDARVPRPQSEELHMALKKLGVPTEFIVYPRMGHGLTEPRFQMVKMVAEYNWFEKWIRGKPDWFEWKDILDTVK